MERLAPPGREPDGTFKPGARVPFDPYLRPRTSAWPTAGAAAVREERSLGSDRAVRIVLQRPGTPASGAALPRPPRMEGPLPRGEVAEAHLPRLPVSDLRPLP